MFTKTDLAKYVLTYEMRPHMVSKGAQFAFSAFTVGIEQHINREGQLDPAYFERLIAKAILFQETERIAKELKFPGYRANIVTYSIAKLVHSAKGKIDLNRIWREQRIYPELENAIRKIAQSCYAHITEGSDGGNVTQYCKKESCWTSFQELYVSLPDETTKGFIENKTSVEENFSAQRVVNSKISDPNIAETIRVGSLAWIRLADFGSQRRLFSPKQLNLLTDLGLTIGAGRHPSGKSAEIALALLETARNHGFPE
jgi:hypothetical protein